MKKSRFSRTTILLTNSAAQVNSNYKRDKLDDKFLFLTDERLLKQFKTNANNRSIMISEDNYEEITILGIHDAHRTDEAVSRSLDTIIYLKILFCDMLALLCRLKFMKRIWRQVLVFTDMIRIKQ